MVIRGYCQRTENRSNRPDFYNKSRYKLNLKEAFRQVPLYVARVWYWGSNNLAVFAKRAIASEIA